MNRALSQAIVKQLSVSMNGLPQRGVWQSFDDRDWDECLAWLDLSGLAIYLRNRLEGADCLRMLPDRIRERLDRCAADNRLRAAAITEELKELSELFARAGTGNLVLKGIALLPDYCPDLSLRTQYDHDFLIRPEALDVTEALLRETGYRRKEPGSTHPIVYHRPDPGLRFAADFVGLYSPRLGRAIELHLELWETGEERIEINLPADLFKRAVTRRWQDFEYLSLSEEDVLLFQVLHAFRHILRNWCRLSIFLEIAYFLNQRFSDQRFWQRYSDRIENVAWAREATVVVFGLAGHLFGAPTPHEIKARATLASHPALALWTERYGKNSAMANFRRDKYSLFLHREFVKDRAAWAGIRRKRLFPMHRPHRPPAAVFQRGFSRLEKLRLQWFHGIRRVRFHALAALRYAWEYPQWTFLSRGKSNHDSSVKAAYDRPQS